LRFSAKEHPHPINRPPADALQLGALARNRLEEALGTRDILRLEKHATGWKVIDIYPRPKTH
jgi:hypothetical protein